MEKHQREWILGVRGEHAVAVATGLVSVVNDGCDEPAEFDISRKLRMNKLCLVLSSSKLMMVAEVSEYEFKEMVGNGKPSSALEAG